MQSVDTSAMINYQTPRNLLNASVAFAHLVGSTDTNYLTVTDNTDYDDVDPSDAAGTVSLTVVDKFKTKKEYGFAGGGSKTIDLVAEGFNDTDGLDMIVTVASENRVYKDGTATGVGTGKPSGNFVMEL